MSQAHSPASAPSLTKTPPRETDPELLSVKQLLRSLDRMAKSTRTYGATNAVAVKFFTQFYQELGKHLETYQTLGFLVQRSELFYKDQCVYATEEALGENLAFKLYSDGIRELTFLDGTTEEDVRAFLDSLWGVTDGSDADDDIVTRIWAKNLTTIIVVTAEEIVKSSVESELFKLHEQGYFGQARTSLSDVMAREKTQGGSGSPRQATIGLVGYEVSDEDMQSLAAEIEAESATDHTLQVLEMVKAILASETSPVLLTKAIGIFDGAVDVLLRAGNWTTLIEVSALLREIEALSPALTAAHKEQIKGLLADSVKPDRLRFLEGPLNRSGDAPVDGLADYLGQFSFEAIPALCGLLGNLQHSEHRTIVTMAMAALAREHPEPLLRALTDKRPHVVKAVLAILVKLNEPRFADAIEKLIRYPDASVRREILRALAQLRPNGSGAKLVTFVADEDELIRLNALKLLTSGQYTCGFDVWEPLLQADPFAARPPAERRAIFQAIRASVGDGAVPFWRGLLADWGWTGRQKKEDVALLAIDALGRLATPAAQEALQYGQRKGNAIVRQACTTALTAPPPRSRAV
ncbi:hypothetical protein YTPLAS18_20710 [Nitrospira sp.]|nr:hypothetical protein YTPLAS18_20710 [Nitrospira sp.]